MVARKIARAAFDIHCADVENRHVLNQRNMLIDAAIDYGAEVVTSRYLQNPGDHSFD